MKKKHIGKWIALGAVVLVIVALGVTMAITHSMIKENFGRGSDSPYSILYRDADVADRYPHETVSFMSGKNRLQGYIYGAENDKGLVVVSHGIGGAHEHYVREIVFFVDNGWRVFAYDATGSGQSEGEGTMGLPQSALDLHCALTYIEQNETLRGLKKFLFGHSWGGYAAAAVLRFDHDVSACASIAGYNDPMDMMVYQAKDTVGPAIVVLRPFAWADMRLQFGDSMNMTAVDGINHANVPVMIVHGTEDETIGYDSVSVMAQRDKITNPYVRYITIDTEGFNGHTSIFNTPELMEYLEEANVSYRALYEKYDGNIPEAELDAFYSALDKPRANMASDVAYAVEAFFEEVLATR